jgi:DNA (cytosine-5)-methyltransferase 1
MKYKPYFLEDVKSSAERKLFTVISTFAGGGGSSTGYKLAGGEILAVNEFVDAALDTYHANYPNTPSLTGDIKDLTGQDFLDLTGLQKGELDLLDGSPPCSAFSISGSREKGWNKEKKYSQDKKVSNVEDLFFEYIRIANDIQPKVFVGENVNAIMFGEARKYYNRIIMTMEDCGYTAIGDILNAADFGTPQNRRRCFFVAIRNDILEKTDLNFMTLSSSIYPQPTYKEPVTIYEAIHDLKTDETEEQELFDAIQNGFLSKWLPQLNEKYGVNLKDKSKKGSDVHPKGSLFNLVRPAINLPCPTVTQMGQQKNVSGVLHYEKDRKLSSIELKRIQGLPEDYILTGTFNQKAERICRMVAPQCLEALASSIYKNIFSVL